MLNNPFYSGVFIYSGKWYKGSYEPIVSKELFDAVQKKMIVPPKSKPGTKQFDFTKLFRCGTCGSGITAQEKYKRCKNGIKKYIYYHCTKFNNRQCKEPYTREEKLIEQLIEISKQILAGEIEKSPTLKPELDKVTVIKRLQNPDQPQDQKESIPTDFVNYIFFKGTREQKRELVNCLNKALYLQDQQIITK